jgi:hypothetical protein
MIGRHVSAVRNYYRSIRQLLRSFGGAETTGFAVAGANQLITGVSPMMFLEAALAENRRLLGLLDYRLVKPALLPTLAATALTLLRALPPRADTLRHEPAAVPDLISPAASVAA